MSTYYLNEAVIDLPERPFVDKTIHGLESKLPGDKTLGVLVHRRPVEGERSLHALVAENVALNQKRLMAFKVLDEAEGSVGGVPGILLRTSWHNERATYYQLQAHVVFDGKVMIFAVSGPIEEQAACDETFQSILQTITWRTE
ncbi:MAG: DcrB-related protein [Polyangiaceae bacterium]|nr:DcrB-related protein [Polyangiaceae bacterium]